MISNKFSLLYVEDDALLREQYVPFFQLFFHDVYKAKDGKEALCYYKNHNPDIVILDINIPKINGLEVAKKIRQENEDVILIMLTAHSDKEKLLDAIELKLTKYLIKPIRTFEFENILTNVIEKLAKKKKKENILYLSGGFMWNKKNQELLSDKNDSIKLTKKERLLVKLFCENPKMIFSKEDILNYVWENEQDDYNPNKLRIIFSKLKVKLDCNLFESVYNVGYKLKGNF